MNTIEHLKKLESELETLAKVYSGTMASVTLDEEKQNISKVLCFLIYREEWFKHLYYKNLLKANVELLSAKEVEKLNKNWLSSKDMIELCNKYNIEYNVIEFNK